MKTIEIKAIITEAKPGRIVFDCVAEAAELAMQQKRLVMLTHNGKTFNIDPEDIVKAIMGMPIKAKL